MTGLFQGDEGRPHISLDLRLHSSSPLTGITSKFKVLALVLVDLSDMLFVVACDDLANVIYVPITPPKGAAQQQLRVTRSITRSTTNLSIPYSLTNNAQVSKVSFFSVTATAHYPLQVQQPSAHWELDSGQRARSPKTWLTRGKLIRGRRAHLAIQRVRWCQ